MLLDSFTKMLSFLILSTAGLGFILLSFRCFSAFIKGYGYNHFWTADFPFFKTRFFHSKKDTNIFSRINSLLMSILLLFIGLGLIVATFLKH